MVPVTKTATWGLAANKDTVAPTIDGIAVTAGATGTNKIVVTFTEDINAVTAVNKANYVVKTSVDGVAWNTTLTPLNVVYDAANMTATIIFAETLTASAANNKYQVTVKNVKDLAGNVQVEGNSLVTPQ